MEDIKNVHEWIIYEQKDMKRAKSYLPSLLWQNRGKNRFQKTAREEKGCHRSNSKDIDIFDFKRRIQSKKEEIQELGRFWLDQGKFTNRAEGKKPKSVGHKN